MFMKKIVLSVLMLTGVVVAVNAQSTAFKPFKVDFAVGYAIPGGSGAKAGVLFAFEPKYAINNNITAGLRFEGAVVARAVKDANGDYTAGEVKAAASYVATADYYFNTNTFRPFVGVGAGLFSTAGASVDSNGDVVEGASASKFGGVPRVGFELGHFRMAVEYNVVGKTGDITNSYIGIKLGFFAGGGRTGK
jgi:outer membrane protein W